MEIQSKYRHPIDPESVTISLCGRAGSCELTNVLVSSDWEGDRNYTFCRITDNPRLNKALAEVNYIRKVANMDPDELVLGVAVYLDDKGGINYDNHNIGIWVSVPEKSFLFQEQTA